MAQRISVSQLRNRIRQAQQKQKQAIDGYNQAVRQHNQKVRQRNQKINQAINQYNQAVRTHNSRVRANQQRLRSELARLRCQPTRVTHHVVYRTSVHSLHEAYTRLEQRAEAQQLSPAYDRVLDLSERETANSLEVTNRLLEKETDSEEHVDPSQNSALLDQLRGISEDLDDRWHGAVFALNPNNPDAARHFCTSAREIVTQILEIKAPDKEVISLLPNCDRTDQRKPTRRAKIKYLLHRSGMTEDTLEEFVEQDMENIVQLFRVFNQGTHGKAGSFGFQQLAAIKKRVEDGIIFLAEISGAA